MTNQEQRIQRYLLGQLPEAEQAALEEAYFNDRRLFDQMVQVENELVDKYARGLLSPATRESFEKHYLAHPKRRERANFATALATRLDERSEVVAVYQPSAGSPWNRLLASMRGPKLAWGFSVALLLMTVVAAWFLLETRRLRQDLNAQEQRERELQQQATNERQRAEELAAELERRRDVQPAVSPSPTPIRSAPAFATLILSVGGTRSIDGAAPALLVIPPGTEQVRIQLNLRENAYASYRVVVQAADGREIFASARLIAKRARSGVTVTLTLPAQKFANGDYILTLRGVSKTGEVEDASKSFFRVERQ
jgi:anti-sigma factor RsiW